MKKILLPVLILVATLFTSCGKTYDPTVYQYYPMTVCGRFVEGDFCCSVRVNMLSEDSAEILVEGPETLANYGFKVDKDEIWVYYDDVQINLDQAPITGITDIADMLSLKNETYKYSGNDLIDGINTKYSVFETDDRKITVYTESGSDTPYRIEMETENRTPDFYITDISTEKEK